MILFLSQCSRCWTLLSLYHVSSISFMIFIIASERKNTENDHFLLRGQLCSSAHHAYSLQSLCAFLYPTPPKFPLQNIKRQYKSLSKACGLPVPRKEVFYPKFMTNRHQVLEVLPDPHNTNDNNAKKQAEKTNTKHVLPIILSEDDLDEKFVRCTGNGGQKVNKSSSKVDLVHLPTGIKVSCQDFRDLSSNRERARKLMRDKLDLHFNGKLSKIGVKQDLVRKRKKNSARKSKKKYGAASVENSDNVI